MISERLRGSKYQGRLYSNETNRRIDIIKEGMQRKVQNATVF